MRHFKPKIETLPQSQQILWEELYHTPKHFTLYGGTALALRLGHRKSVDFDFFSAAPLEGSNLIKTIPYLEEAKVLDISKNTLTCLVNRGGPVKMQFFGGLPIGVVEPREEASGSGVFVASLIDIAASKAKVLPERNEAKDYVDIHALLKGGIDLSRMIAAAKIVYGQQYNPTLTVKALCYYKDVKGISPDIQLDLKNAALEVNFDALPSIKPAQSFRKTGTHP